MFEVIIQGNADTFSKRQGKKDHDKPEQYDEYLAIELIFRRKQKHEENDKSGQERRRHIGEKPGIPCLFFDIKPTQRAAFVENIPPAINR